MGKFVNIFNIINTEYLDIMKLTYPWNELLIAQHFSQRAFGHYTMHSRYVDSMCTKQYGNLTINEKSIYCSFNDT